MGVDRQTNIRGIGAHFDRKRRFGDEVSGRRSNNTTPDNSLVFFVEQDFGDALITSQRERPSARRPWKDPLAVFDTVGLGFDFGQALPDQCRQPTE